MNERVYTVVGSTATPATPVSLSAAGLQERSDLQEWVLAHPEILGPDVLVVTFEFDRWASSGGRERDRLDVLGIDSDGRIVVAELKRDRAPDTVDMQAIKYAAMASRFTEDTLVEQYARFLGRRGEPVSEEDARQTLIRHAGELDPELLRQPRIVLVAGSFPSVVTATAVWLTDMGLSLTLQQVSAYRVYDERVVITVSQLFPVPDVEEFTVSPQRQLLKEAAERRGSPREKSTVLRLVASGAIPDGTPLFLRPTTEVDAETRSAIDSWVAEDPGRGRATWFNTRRQPLQWEFDSNRYRPTEIARRVVREAAGLERSLRGPAWWTLEDGRDLPTVAGVPERGTFDWSTLHALLGAIPKGHWTTYGDLAQVTGTSALPLGQHITHCTVCPNAWRVLGGDGRPRAGFTWSDPTRTDSQQDALTEEGVRFVGGVADDTQRLRTNELESLLD